MHIEASTDSAQPLPGDFAIWIFIFAELAVFGVLFATYAFARSTHVDLFNASQLTLNRTSGFANTLVLVTSSYFVARGDGSSQFSRTLDEHNQAVNRYQRSGK